MAWFAKLQKYFCELRINIRNAWTRCYRDDFSCRQKLELLDSLQNETDIRFDLTR